MFSIDLNYISSKKNTPKAQIEQLMNRVVECLDAKEREMSTANKGVGSFKMKALNKISLKTRKYLLLK